MRSAMSINRCQLALLLEKIYSTIYTFIKSTFTNMSKHIGVFLLIIIILCVAFWIRIQGVDTIPEGQFTSNDAYFYYRQAQIVSEQGHLPARDMDRWLPIGRDNRQILPLYGYVVAYTHKVITLISPNTSLYHVMLYIPTYFFVIGLSMLCFLLYRMYGAIFSATVGVLLATMPSAIARSTAGFSDRDSWCIMLGIIAVITYLASLEMLNSKNRMIYTLASGVSCFLGGHSWEGFGVFVNVILFVEICRFLTIEKDEDLIYYFLWVLTFVPTLFLTSHPYRSGEWFAQHITAFMLMPPLVLLLIRYIRYFLTTNRDLTEKLRPHARTLALVLTLISFTVGILYTMSQLDTFSLTTVPLSKSHLMETVGELKNPVYGHWVFGFGSVFFLGCIGLIVTSIHLWDKKSLVLVVALVVFTATTFFRDQIDSILGSSVSNQLFFGSIACAIIGILFVAWLRKQQEQNENSIIAFAIWFLFWTALSRDAIRYKFFIGISIAFFTAVLFKLILESMCKKINIIGTLQIVVKTAATTLFLALLMFWTPVGAHAKHAIFMVKHGMHAKPGNSKVEKTFRWMKSNLIDTACVAANWSYGSQLNVLGGVKTIIDQDHYVQHWIHLFHEHVYTARSDFEALRFLYTHMASHLMLTSEILYQLPVIYSFVGSKPRNDQKLLITPLHVNVYKNGHPYFVPVFQDPPFTHIDIDQKPGDNPPIITTAKLKDGSSIDMPNILYRDNTRIKSQKQTDENNGGLLVFYNSQKNTLVGYHISSMGWNSLAVRLFFRGESSDTFVPVYPEDGDPTAEVKVWEIRYPPGIKANPKYLETKPPKQQGDTQ